MHRMLTSRSSRMLIGALMLMTATAYAQGPHEIALIVNQNSADSIEIAHTYAKLRRVPPSNIVYLDLPESMLDLYSIMSLAEFRSLILEPTTKAIAERRIGDHILAWVYSADIPIRIGTTVPISLTGATFTRGELPEMEQIQQGRFPSPLFRGPTREGEPGAPSGSLQEFAVLLKEKMPLPAMVLGYTGARGVPVTTIIENLRRAAAADGTRPRDPVFFHMSDDVRSKARQWQFAAAAEELQKLGMPAQVSSNRPAATQPLIGLMLGTAYTDAPWGRLQPGSLADNLTSLGAYFHTFEQTRISHWLEHGAAASAGTVSEPFAIWTKFPNARLFAHYARGCTALESYAQSTASPLQLLPVGDPLCKPWSRPIPLTLISLDDTKGAVSGTASFIASTLMQQPGMSHLFLIDGRAIPAGGASGLRMDTTQLSDGYHELTAVVYSPGPVRSQGLANLGFTVDNHGQFARLTLPSGTNATVDLHHSFDALVSASKGATGLVIAVNGRPLWQGGASTQEQRVVLSAKQIGPGPSTLNATAFFPENAQVRSAPVSITVGRYNKPPTAPAITKSILPDSSTNLRAQSTDPDGDEVHVTWFANLLASDIPRATSNKALQNAGNGAWTLSTTSGSVVIALPATTGDLEELSASLALNSYLKESGQQMGGVVFDYTDDENYSVFGWHWVQGGWVLGRFEKGHFRRILARGMPLDPQQVFSISLKQTGATLVVLVNDKVIGTTDQLHLRGPIGISGGIPNTTISRLALSPPPGVSKTAATTPLIPVTDAPLLIRAADQASSAWTAYP